MVYDSITPEQAQAFLAFHQSADGQRLQQLQLLGGAASNDPAISQESMALYKKGSEISGIDDRSIFKHQFDKDLNMPLAYANVMKQMRAIAYRVVERETVPTPEDVSFNGWNSFLENTIKIGDVMPPSVEEFAVIQPTAIPQALGVISSEGHNTNEPWVNTVANEFNDRIVGEMTRLDQDIMRTLYTPIEMDAQGNTTGGAFREEFANHPIGQLATILATIIEQIQTMQMQQNTNAAADIRI